MYLESSNGLNSFKMFFFFRITPFINLGSARNFKIETVLKFLNVQLSIEEKLNFFVDI